MKAFANRGKDWMDVGGIIIRQQDNLDWPYIQKQLGPLCELKESPEITEKLKSLRRKLA